jgi:hypothetical protein
MTAGRLLVNTLMLASILLGVLLGILAYGALGG